MAEVKQKRSARLPKGPKASEVSQLESDEVIYEDDTGSDTGSKGSSEVVSGNDKRDDTVTNGDTNSGGSFKEIVKIESIPHPPSKAIRDNDKLFYDYCASLDSVKHWPRLIWYLYRTHPRIVRPDEQKNIDSDVRPLTYDRILKSHGSGDYYVILNDTGRPKNAKEICRAYLKVDDLDHPPIINMEELDVDYKGNKRFVDQCIAKGLLTVDKKPMNSMQTQGALNGDLVIRLLEKTIDKMDANAKTQPVKENKDETIAAVISMMNKGNEAATQMLINQMKENDPTKLITLLSAIKEMFGAKESTNDGGLLKLLLESQNKNLELIQNNNKTQMDLMFKMLEMKSEKKEDNEEGVIRKMMMYKELFESFGGGGGGGGGRQKWWESLLEYGAPILDKVAGIVQNTTAIKARTVTGNPQPQVNGQQQQQRVQAIPQVSTSDAKDNVIETEFTETNGNGVNKSVEDAMGDGMIPEHYIKQGIAEIVPKIISAMERDIPGDQFAEAFVIQNGNYAYNVISNLGIEKIVDYTKQNIQLWQVLGPQEKAYRQFVKDFLAFGDPDEEDNENPEKEGADVKEIKKKGVIES